MADEQIFSEGIEVFFSYSHKDEPLRDELEKYLSKLKRQKLISAWYDRKIGAGVEWKGQIDGHLDSARIILLLISADFLSSDYCYDIEMKRAMERHESGEARVIPIILRPVDWRGAPFGALQALPSNAIPIVLWKSRNRAFLNITNGIRNVIQNLNQSLIREINKYLEASESVATTNPENATIFDVFLCYNNKDLPSVKNIAYELKNNEINPWLDEWELRPGLPWQEILEDQIERINSVAVFVGKDGFGPWQDQEIKAFLQEFVKRKCPVIPVILPEAQMDVPKLPIFLKGFTWVDFRKNDPNPIKRLIWGITGKKIEI
jgi:hypothetical protein